VIRPVDAVIEFLEAEQKRAMDCGISIAVRKPEANPPARP
jgi:hypothetical protein